MADGELRGLGVAVLALCLVPRKWEASREWDSICPSLLLLSISDLPSSTQVTLMVTGETDVL